MTSLWFNFAFQEHVHLLLGDALRLHIHARELYYAHAYNHIRGGGGFQLKLAEHTKTIMQQL